MVLPNRICVKLVAKDLEVAYGDNLALKIDDLQATGSIFAVIGHNGSGKSTLMKTVLGLLPARLGDVHAYLAETGRFSLLVPERHMAFAPEHGAIFEDLSVESYVQLWCRIKHFDSGYYKKAGARIIERLRIPPLLKKLGRELSKGQRQRVQAAIGFLAEPKLFLFDEPFDGLDLKQSSELGECMLDEAYRTSMVVSSHRIEVVERLADVFVVLRNGELLTSGSLEEVCGELAGTRITIANGKDTASSLAIAELLRQHYRRSSVNQVGNEISVVGEGLNAEDVGRLLAEHGYSEHSIEVGKPSLIEAMNYHLRIDDSRQD